MKLLIRVAYDGRYFCGFQSQKNGRSVQEKLTEVFSRFFGFPCAVTGCSRTDAGVHARGFCCTVSPVEARDMSEAWQRIPPAKLHRAVNRYLAPHMAVTGACMVTDAFHPRYDVLSKTYAYRIWDGPAVEPFLAPYVWHVHHCISDDGVQRMHSAAQELCGTHDFSSYMAAGSRITDAVRTVTDASVMRGTDGLLTFRVTADGFLYNMVRILAGTLYEIAIGARDGALSPVTEAHDRRCAGITAPPDGLILEEVRYPEKWGVCWQCE